MTLFDTMLQQKIDKLPELRMYQIQLKFMGQSKKITIAKSLPPHELNKLIGQCFNLTERVVGVTDQAGKFYELHKLSQELATHKEAFSLVTVRDLRQQSHSFGSDFYRSSPKDYEQDQGEPTLELPAFPPTNCQGMIGDLQLFEEMVLPEDKITVVACFTKIKPPAQLPFEFYMYHNESKNSVTVYSGTSKVCEFFVNDWTDPNPEVGTFVQGLTGETRDMKKKRSYDKFSL